MGKHSGSAEQVCENYGTDQPVLKHIASRSAGAEFLAGIAGRRQGKRCKADNRDEQKNQCSASFPVRTGIPCSISGYNHLHCFARFTLYTRRSARDIADKINEVLSKTDTNNLKPGQIAHDSKTWDHIPMEIV